MLYEKLRGWNTTHMEDITTGNYKQKFHVFFLLINQQVLNIDEKTTLALTARCSKVFSTSPRLIKGKSQLPGLTFCVWSQI